MYASKILLNVKVLQEHKFALRELARCEGESMSVTLRRLIKDAALAKGLWPVSPGSNEVQINKERNHVR